MSFFALIRAKCIIACCIFLFSSCTYNPFTTNHDFTGNNVAGPIIGGVGAASSAALLGASKTWIGIAGVGGIGLGYYMTTLQYASQEIIKVKGQVYQVGDYVGIVIPTDALFEENSADLLQNAYSILQSAMKVLNHYPNDNILISGNSSGFNTRAQELRLTKARAKKIAAYFYANGISNFTFQSNNTRKLIYTGFGNDFPIANHFKAKSIRENSRIQITAYPSTVDLALDKRYELFNNIGATSAMPTKQNNIPIYSFVADGLPDAPEHLASGFPKTDQTSYDTKNYKGDVFDDFNNVKKELNTQSGVNSSKQGGYKGEGDFKAAKDFKGEGAL